MYVIHVSVQISNKYLYVVYLICIATAPALNCLVGNTFEDGMKCTTTEFQKRSGRSGNMSTIHPKTWNLQDILVI